MILILRQYKQSNEICAFIGIPADQNLEKHNFEDLVSTTCFYTDTEAIVVIKQDSNYTGPRCCLST